ncbi:MAG TPA: hypothetical protein VI541_01065 [Actinomycetota bacterium]|nr:hypothetical protein [Actinomycetota bacterium]
MALLSACQPKDVPDKKASLSRSPSPSAGAQVSGTSTPSAAPSATSSILPPPEVKGGSLSRSAVQPPKPGDYLMDATGKIKISGCMDTERPPPTPMTVTVEAPDGDRQRITQSSGGGSGDGQRTTLVLEYRVEGVYLTFLRIERTGIASSASDFTPNPPVLVYPADPRVGQSWTYTLATGDGSMKIDSTSTVSGLSESVQLGDGSRASAHRITTARHVTAKTTQGDTDVRSTEVSWFAPAPRLQVRSVEDSSGTSGICRLDSHVESVLRSAG